MQKRQEAATLDEKQIEKIIEKAVKKAVEATNEANNAREAQKAYNMTFEYLKTYKDMLTSLENAEIAESAPKNTFLEAAAESKKQTAAIIAILNKALQELEQEQQEKGQIEKYRVMCMYFFDGMTYEEILNVIRVGDSTPRRWVGEMVAKLAKKIFGAQAIHK